MTEYESIRSMVLNFRLSELQSLLAFSGQSRHGRKSDLQTRALQLISGNPRDICNKVKELSNAMYSSLASATSVNPYSSNYDPDVNIPSRETRSKSSQNSSKSQEKSPKDKSSNTSNKSSHNTPSSGYSTADSRNSASEDFLPLNVSNPYNYSTLSGASSPLSMYPLTPDVKLRRLPFYDVEAVLMNPSSLQPQGNNRYQEQMFKFHMTPAQATAIGASTYLDETRHTAYKKQIQLRFSLLETSCEQDDNFPLSLNLKINGRMQSLPNPIPTVKPGVEPRRPPKPINITPLCKLMSTVSNYINISWAVEPGRAYTVSVYYVTKLTSEELLHRLKRKGMRLADYTRAVIKDKLNDKDSEIATTSCKVSLACPLGKMRMTLPCRASTCDHLQCFDASLYIKMNEKKPKWLCPVCNKPALYDNLLLDGFFSEVLESPRLPDDEHEIVLHQDASWDPLPVKQDSHRTSSGRAPVQSEQSSAKFETLDIDDDESDPTPGPSTNNSFTAKDKVIDCITLDSDSEDEIAPPRNKRPRLTALLDDEEETSSTSSILSSFLPSEPSPYSDSMPPPGASSSSLPVRPQAPSLSPPLICLDDD